MKSSCLITCYNTAEYIVQCAESCSQFDEIIIGFDGCTDGSVEAVQEWLAVQPQEIASKYQLIAREENIGVQANRNSLFHLSSGDAVCWMDGDDFRTSDLTDLVGKLAATSNWVAGLITPYEFWARDILYASEAWHTSRPDWTDPDKPEYGNIPSVWELLAWRGIQVGGILWKREYLEQVDSHYGRIWDTNQEVLQEVNLLLDTISLGCEFSISLPISHIYRWGWSDQQITQQRRDLYPARLESYYTRLRGMAPSYYLDTILKWQNDSVKAATQIAEDFKLYGIDPIEPELA